MTGVELAIVIEGSREDWPRGQRTLTPHDPIREPNGRTLWFGAGLDPDGEQVWFRIDEDAIGRMPEKTPTARGDRLVDGPGLRNRRHVDRTAAVVMDSLAPTRPAAAELERPPATARRLAEASVSPNTRRAYSGALRRLDAWLDGRPLEDATLAAYLAELHDQGRAPASASTAVGLFAGGGEILR